MSEVEFARLIKGAQLSEKEIVELRKNFGLSINPIYAFGKNEKVLEEAFFKIRNTA